MIASDPLLDFRLTQEAAKQAEGQLADGLMAKIRLFNAAVGPPKRLVDAPRRSILPRR